MADWSRMNKTILTGALSDPSFAVPTEKMNRARVGFRVLFFSRAFLRMDRGDAFFLSPGR